MLKKTINYTDLNGNEQKTTRYFNLTKSEIVKLENSVKGGFTVMLRHALATGDSPVVMEGIEKLILSSYGEKSADGQSFIKFRVENGARISLADEFMQTPAYDALFMELLTDDNASDAFMRGVIPSDMAKQLPANIKEALPEELQDMLAEEN